MPEENELFLSDDALFALVSTLATEVIRYGELESQLINSPKLSDDQSLVIMKSNTLLTTFAMLLVRVVASDDVDFAKMVVEVWTDPTVQDMVRIAFAEEIQEAVAVVSQGIDDIEQSVNKETNDTPSESGD